MWSHHGKATLPIMEHPFTQMKRLRVYITIRSTPANPRRRKATTKLFGKGQNFNIRELFRDTGKITGRS